MLVAPRRAASGGVLTSCTYNAPSLSLRQHTKFTKDAPMNITQCRMARAGLGWSWDDLASTSGVSRRTIAKFEAGETVSPETIAKLQSALIAAGAAFTNGGGRLGVSLPRQD